MGTKTTSSSALEQEKSGMGGGGGGPEGVETGGWHSFLGRGDLQRNPQIFCQDRPMLMRKGAERSLGPLSKPDTPQYTKTHKNTHTPWTKSTAVQDLACYWEPPRVHSSASPSFTAQPPGADRRTCKLEMKFLGLTSHNRIQQIGFKCKNIGGEVTV